MVVVDLHGSSAAADLAGRRRRVHLAVAGAESDVRYLTRFTDAVAAISALPLGVEPVPSQEGCALSTERSALRWLILPEPPRHLPHGRPSWLATKRASGRIGFAYWRLTGGLLAAYRRLAQLNTQPGKI